MIFFYLHFCSYFRRVLQGTAAARQWRWLSALRAQGQVRVQVRPRGADGDQVAGGGSVSKDVMSSREGESQPWEGKERKGEGE